MNIENEIQSVKNNAVSLILEAKSKEELEELTLQFLGKNGALTLLMKEITGVPKEKRPEIGVLINEVKGIVEDAIAGKMNEFREEKKVRLHKRFDITDPGVRPPLGHLHLITQGIEEITSIFNSIGFTRVRYPEVERDWFAFEALNFPENHPARDDWETFFIDEKSDPALGPMLLTPHTSSGQIREMLSAAKSRNSEGLSAAKSREAGGKVQNEEISIKMLNLAKTYRRQSDVSHTPMFHQFETLCIGKNISITHLKGMLDYFVKSYFGPTRKSRIRPYHFQFTEPSFETDVSCGVCNGTTKLPNGETCKLCKQGWLEMGGAGMVHPNVLKNCGLDPNVYTGFASGWGVERVVMMKEGLVIDDLRLMYSNKLEFLEQF